MKRLTGKEIKKLRKEQLMTVDDLADASGVHRSTICRIEAGGPPPRPSTMRAIATALGVIGGKPATRQRSTLAARSPATVEESMERIADAMDKLVEMAEKKKS